MCDTVCTTVCGTICGNWIPVKIVVRMWNNLWRGCETVGWQKSVIIAAEAEGPVPEFFPCERLYNETRHFCHSSPVNSIFALSCLHLLFRADLHCSASVPCVSILPQIDGSTNHISPQTMVFILIVVLTNNTLVFCAYNDIHITDNI